MGTENDGEIAGLLLPCLPPTACTLPRLLLRYELRVFWGDTTTTRLSCSCCFCFARAATAREPGRVFTPTPPPPLLLAYAMCPLPPWYRVVHEAVASPEYRDPVASTLHTPESRGSM